MKNYIIIILNLFVVGLAQHLHAGVGSSGGGYAVICDNGPGKNPSVFLYDLFEGYFRYSLLTKPQMNDPSHELLEFYKVYSYYTGDSVESLINDFGSSIDVVMSKAGRFLEQDERLTPANDLGFTITLPRGCHLNQLAHFHSVGNRMFTTVDRTLWNLMDAKNRVALIAHEAIYFQYSSFGDMSSEMTRKVVARMFSTQPLDQIKLNPQLLVLRCFGSTPSLRNEQGVTQFYNQTEFYVYQKAGSPIVTFRFRLLFGRNPFSIAEVNFSQNENPLWKRNQTSNNFLERNTITSGNFYGYSIALSGRDRNFPTMTLFDNNGTRVSEIVIEKCEQFSR